MQVSCIMHKPEATTDFPYFQQHLKGDPQTSSLQHHHHHYSRHFMMCHQVIQVFECGHSNNAKKVPCGKPSNCGQEVFLRQELEDIKGLCAVRYGLGII